MCIILWVWQLHGVVCGYNHDMKHLLPPPEVPWSPFCTEPSPSPWQPVVWCVSRVLPRLGAVMLRWNRRAWSLWGWLLHVHTRTLCTSLACCFLLLSSISLCEECPWSGLFLINLFIETYPLTIVEARPMPLLISGGSVYLLSFWRHQGVPWLVAASLQSASISHGLLLSPPCPRIWDPLDHPVWIHLVVV